MLEKRGIKWKGGKKKRMSAQCCLGNTAAASLKQAWCSYKTANPGMSIPDKQRGTNIGSRNEIQVELLSTFPCHCCSTMLKLGRWICFQRKISLCGRVAYQTPKALPAAGNVARAMGCWPGLSWWSPHKPGKCPGVVCLHWDCSASWILTLLYSFCSREAIYQS